MGGRAIAVILSLAVFLAPARGDAQDAASGSTATTEEDARARELYELGDRLYAHGQYDAAIDAFREAHRLSHRPLMLFNLANAQERAGYLADAVVSLEGYLPHAPVEERTEVSNRLAALRERVAQAALDTAVVSHHDPGPAPEPVPAEVAPAPASSGTPPAPDAPSTASGPDLTPAGVLFGVAGAFVLAGVSLGIVALDQRSQIDARCARADGRLVCPADVSPALETDTIVSALADVSIVLAAASVALGVYSLVDALFEPSGPDPGQPVEVRAAFLPDAAYVGLQARFH